MESLAAGNRVAKLLIVDPNRSQTVPLGFALSAADHTVEITGNSLEAIEMGLRLQPDVVLLDWVLEGPYNGIEVAESLRAVFPRLHSILVTAHASRDLRGATKKAGFIGFLEKPLDPARVRVGIEKALTHAPSPSPVSVGLLQYQPSGGVVFANDRARESLRLRGDASVTVANIFNYKTQSELAYARGEWVKLTINEEIQPRFLGAVREGMDGVLQLFFLERGQVEMKTHPAIGRLTGAAGPGASTGPSEDHVLVIDPDNLQRRLAASQLKKLGVRFQLADSYEGALRILEQDERVNVCLVDYACIGEDGGAALEELRAKRSELKIVGVSQQYRKREFDALGVEAFLLKPLVADVVAKALA